MTNNDIIRFALMPRFNPYQAEYVTSTEALIPIKEECVILDQLLNKVAALSEAHKKILRHGPTSFIIEEYNDILTEYNINFATQSVDACVEGLSSIVERIWITIKHALIRLWNFITDHPCVTLWFNRCEFYRVRMANIISTSLKAYAKMDINAFNDIKLIGFKKDEFRAKVLHVGNLIAKIKNTSASKFELLNIESIFGQEVAGLGCRFENSTVIVQPPSLTKDTTKKMGWKPFDVYAITNDLYARVATNSMYLTRFSQDLGRTLRSAMADADNVLTGRTEGSDETIIALSKARVNNIRNILMLIQIANSNAYILLSEWYKMASCF